MYKVAPIIYVKSRKYKHDLKSSEIRRGRFNIFLNICPLFVVYPVYIAIAIGLTEEIIFDPSYSHLLLSLSTQFEN
jgi:hypothetical protein